MISGLMRGSLALALAEGLLLELVEAAGGFVAGRLKGFGPSRETTACAWSLISFPNCRCPLAFIRTLGASSTQKGPWI